MARSVDVNLLLHAWRNPRTDVRVAVERWCCSEVVRDQYIVRPKSIRMVWNYLIRVGPTTVWRKIWSRLGETRRNTKSAGIGIGVLQDAPEGCELAMGQRVVFFAPNHSMAWPRISLDARLVHPLAAMNCATSSEAPCELPDAFRALIGWTQYSGVPLDEEAAREGLSVLARSSALSHCASGSGAFEGARGARGSERREAGAYFGERTTAILFGLGNYAKTQIVPHVRKHLHLAEVHEIDPDQIRTASGWRVTLDTSPWPRDNTRHDAWFIAGFHESHAPLAVRALASGAYAVVEKPLATSREQFADLRDALANTKGRRLFACFHKRYSRLNEWAREDLGVQRGEPVDMHCIVYEIPLPGRHWYNWPNSGSRLVSNGCHWLDYFLFVNDYSPVIERYVRRMRGTDLVTVATLENGAQFVMSLTEMGSERLGVRDVIDLRARNTTVRMIDGAFYDAEDSTRTLRRRRLNPMNAYSRMYDTICRRIADGQQGDSLESLRSTELMLDLEAEWRRHPR